MKRLGIIVPCRDRKEHLAQLVPHLAAYFTRDKVDSAVPVKLVIVEQAPINRGLINNIGYAFLRGEVDYVCFYDVDFLPIWADYSYPELPTMIIWFGMESRPFDPARPDKRIWYRLERCLAAVVSNSSRPMASPTGIGAGARKTPICSGVSRRLDSTPRIARERSCRLITCIRASMRKAAPSPCKSADRQTPPNSIENDRRRHRTTLFLHSRDSGATN